jgi:hypothetical protein
MIGTRGGNIDERSLNVGFAYGGEVGPRHARYHRGGSDEESGRAQAACHDLGLLPVNKWRVFHQEVTPKKRNLITHPNKKKVKGEKRR